LTNLLGALYSFPGGYLADRIGTKRSLLVFNCMAMAGYLIVIIFPYWYAVLVGSILFLSWSAISLPATMKLVSKVLPKNKRTMGVTIHSLVRRFPMALGPIIGGYCIAAFGERDGVRYGFVVALALSIVSAIVQQFLIEKEPSSKQSHSAEGNPLRLLSYMSPGLRKLLVADILIRFCEQIPAAFVVLWCMKTITHTVSAVQFGVLTSIEMATAVLIYIPVAYFADRSSKKPFVVATFVFFTLFPLVLLLSHSYLPLILAFIIRGLKEFGEPTRKALIMDLAPEDKKAGMFGLYYLLRDVIVSAAAFGGALLWKIGPEVNLLCAFGFGVVGTLWFALFGTDVSSQQPLSPSGKNSAVSP
ncbi:MAG: MFS transporter, partial [Chitinivibrionales bacterium]|nr:MFS transporter [Chitinivibrionales bacterium]